MYRPGASVSSWRLDNTSWLPSASSPEYPWVANRNRPSWKRRMSVKAPSWIKGHTTIHLRQGRELTAGNRVDCNRGNRYPDMPPYALVLLLWEVRLDTKAVSPEFFGGILWSLRFSQRRSNPAKSPEYECINRNATQEKSVCVPYGQQAHIPATVQGQGRRTESLDCTHPSHTTDKVQIPCISSTHIAICLGALGIFGALSVLGCPARSVSLK